MKKMRLMPNDADQRTMSSMKNIGYNTALWPTPPEFTHWTHEQRVMYLKLLNEG